MGKVGLIAKKEAGACCLRKVLRTGRAVNSYPDCRSRSDCNYQPLVKIPSRSDTLKKKKDFVGENLAENKFAHRKLSTPASKGVKPPPNLYPPYSHRI